MSLLILALSTTGVIAIATFVYTLWPEELNEHDPRGACGQRVDQLFLGSTGPVMRGETGQVQSQGAVSRDEGWVECRLLDAESREPIEGAEIRDVSSFGAVPKQGSGEVTRVLSDSLGRFAVQTVPGRSTRVLVMATGYLRRDFEVTAVRKAYVVGLVRQVQLAGALVDDLTGVPVSGTVLARESRVEPLSGEPAVVCVADDSGQFTVRGVGRTWSGLLLTAEAQGYLRRQVFVSATDTDLSIRLRRGSIVRGRIDGVPRNERAKLEFEASAMESAGLIDERACFPDGRYNLSVPSNREVVVTVKSNVLLDDIGACRYIGSATIQSLGPSDERELAVRVAREPLSTIQLRVVDSFGNSIRNIVAKVTGCETQDEICAIGEGGVAVIGVPASAGTRIDVGITPYDELVNPAIEWISARSDATMGRVIDVALSDSIVRQFQLLRDEVSDGLGAVMVDANYLTPVGWAWPKVTLDGSALRGQFPAPRGVESVHLRLRFQESHLEGRVDLPQYGSMCDVVSVPRCSTVRGTLTFAAGAAASSGSVFAESVDHPGWWCESELTAGGAFELLGVPVGAVDLVYLDGIPRVTRRIDVRPDRPLELGEWRVPERRVIRGVAMLEGGQPVSNVPIAVFGRRVGDDRRVYPSGWDGVESSIGRLPPPIGNGPRTLWLRGALESTMYAETRSGSDGKFELELPGLEQCVIVGDGGARGLAVERIEEGFDRSERRLTLKPAAMIRVVGARLWDVRAVECRAEAGSSYYWPQLAWRDDGSLSCSVVPGECEIIVYSSRGVRAAALSVRGEIEWQIGSGPARRAR